MPIEQGVRARACTLLARASSAGGPVGVVYHADADGISSAALACDAVERLGGVVFAKTPPKGKNVYDAAFRDELDRRFARAVLVLDTGSRAGVRWRAAPTIIVDHHIASRPPDAELFVHDEAALATSVLVLEIVSALSPMEDRAWLAAVGVLGDRGGASAACVDRAAARFGRGTLRELVALVNASGRASEPRPDVALEALRSAADPRSIVRGEGAAAQHLHAMRAEVATASKRASRVPPHVRGRWAVIELDERCRVHGVVASAWARRLAPRIVLVANKGYVEGRVHIAVRSHDELDLRAALRALLPNEGGDFAAGHARATGAIVDVPTYERLLAAITAEAARSDLGPVSRAEP